MLTKEFVKAVAEVQGGTQKEAKEYVDAIKAVVVDAIERGEDVELKGFVSFTSKAVEAYTAKNPQNGEPVEVPAHRKATATLAKSLRKQ